MAIDLDTIPAITRAQQIKLGRQFSSNDTLAQANQTLNALESYGDLLVPDGFIAADTARLTDARDMLITAGVGRETARAGKKVTNGLYTEAMAEGKILRRRGRAVLENVEGALQESAAPDAQEAVQKIKATLLGTQAAGADAEALATQLDQLAATLKAPGIKAEAAKRGGAQAAADLLAGSAKLRASDEQSAVPAGTPAHTQLLDHLDGIIVGLVRRARKAARSAAARLGNPAIAAAFELDKLYAGPAKKNDKPAPKSPADGPNAPLPPVAPPA
ncbi:MAG: hypothetical protein U0359_21670 [Byssovorax sp.]